MNSNYKESAEDLYEHAPCGFISFAPKGTIVKVNQTLLTWLGYTAEELTGKKRFQDFISVGDRIFYETHFSPLLQMQNSANEINFSLIKKDSTKIPTLVSATLVKDSGGNPAMIRMAIFTISDRKKYESELLAERRRAEQAYRAKSDFVSLLTHEVRTPLNSIIGASHLMAETELTAKQKKYADMLASSSTNLMELLNSILDYSKIDSGKAKIDEHPFDFEQYIRTTALGFQARAIQKNIKLIVEISDAIPEFLCGDKVKIGQIVTNLVGNAIKFTERGSVTLSVEQVTATRDYVDLHFRIADTGIGIKEDIIPKIFEEYSQADSSTGKTYGGTGLGLAIVKRLVALHGSHVKVSSEAGKGSVFSFDLRLRTTDAPRPAELPPIVIDSSLNGVRVLVADDSEDNQLILQLLMERWGVHITEAMNGREALQKLEAAEFDLILMDLRMPVLDGYATAAAIRQLTNPKISKIPIIAFSASATLGDKDIIANMHFQDVIGKPFMPNDLFRKIATFTNRLKTP